MQLNVVRCKRLHLGPSAALVVDMPNSTRGLSLLPRMEQISDLGAVIELSTKCSAQVSKAVFKAHKRLAMLNRTYVQLTPKSFITAYSAIVRSHLEYCVQV